MQIDTRITTDRNCIRLQINNGVLGSNGAQWHRDRYGTVQVNGRPFGIHIGCLNGKSLCAATGALWLKAASATKNISITLFIPAETSRFQLYRFIGGSILCDLHDQSATLSGPPSERLRQSSSLSRSRRQESWRHL